MIFFGCTYYPVERAGQIPMLQKAVCKSSRLRQRSLRATMIPSSRISLWWPWSSALSFFNALLLAVGLRNFHGKSVTELLEKHEIRDDLFWVAGIWGLLVLTPLYFMFDLIGATIRLPSPIQFLRWIVGVGLAWQAALSLSDRPRALSASDDSFHP